jgi:hypothetical protein
VSGKKPVNTTFENFDLKAEAEEARADTVRFAFEFPELLADFRIADAKANKAKKTSRRSGYITIALVLFTLLIGAASPVFHALHFSDDVELVIAYGSAALGLLGAILGLLGLRKSSSRHTWLRNRLKTESMRLFHFQFMAAQFPALIAAGANPALRPAYLAARAKAYLALTSGPLADPDAELHRISKQSGAYDFRAAAEGHLAGMEDTAIAETVFAAWRKLRLQWQLGYCEAMLSPTRTGKRMSARQTEEAFSKFGWASVATVITLHIGLFAADPEPTSQPRALLEVGVVWTALVALAARALEAGLQPSRDVERYEQYRANILVATERFEAADGVAGKLEVMRGFERNSLEEMRIFMRTHSRSSFML